MVSGFGQRLGIVVGDLNLHVSEVGRRNFSVTRRRSEWGAHHIEPGFVVEPAVTTTSVSPSNARLRSHPGWVRIFRQFASIRVDLPEVAELVHQRDHVARFTIR